MSGAGFEGMVSSAAPTRPVWPGGRWLLLLAVMAGLFGMHVLTAESADGGHGSLPIAAPHASHSMSGAVSAAGSSAPALMSASDRTLLSDAVASVAGTLAGVSVSPADSGGMPADHGGLGGCVLFLMVGSTLLLLLALSGRVRLGMTAWSPPLMAWGRVRRRGPPGRDRPRVALCVIRV